MEPRPVLLLVWAALLFALASARYASPLISELYKESQSRANAKRLSRREVDPEDLYPAYNLSVPIGHFPDDPKYAPHTDGTFDLRYWFDASYYKPGGPVIILQSGETSGVGRLPFLQNGILHQLAEATNGIGVVLEHRYYGTSFPVPDLSTENMRFLTTEQALMDEVYFAQNVVFAGFEDQDLTAPNVAYIGYGGSYAGAFVAFLRTQYPDVFWGTISSSGVTEAIYDYWKYYEPVRIYGPPACVKMTQLLTNIIDNLLWQDDPETIAALKSSFSLENVTYNSDFANVLSSGIGGWQSLNWDPEVTSNSFYEYCDNITSSDIFWPELSPLRPTVEKFILDSGYEVTPDLVTGMLNWMGWINDTEVTSCAEQNMTQNGCFSNNNSTYYQQDSIEDDWRCWPYQFCTEWGYLQSGSTVPEDQLSMISRHITLEYISIICREAFGIFTPSNTDAINKYGGWEISYPRLAIIDGEVDPWRPATPHASPFYPVPNRASTVEEPFILIEGAVHHWDENGLFSNETTASLPPTQVVDAQQAEIQFVLEWMEEWKCRK